MLLEGFRVPVGHKSSPDLMARAQIATMRDHLDQVMPHAERFMAAAQRSDVDAGEVGRLFSQAVIAVDGTINSGRDLGAISMASAEAMQDLIDQLRHEAGHQVKNAARILEDGINHVDSKLPSFATEAKSRMKWIHGFALEMASERMGKDERLEL